MHATGCSPVEPSFDRNLILNESNQPQLASVGHSLQFPLEPEEELHDDIIHFWDDLSRILNILLPLRDFD